jgi:hypothetical protein
MRSFVVWTFLVSRTLLWETRKWYMKSSWNSFNVTQKKVGTSLAFLGREVIHPYLRTKQTA